MVAELRENAIEPSRDHMAAGPFFTALSKGDALVCMVQDNLP